MKYDFVIVGGGIIGLSTAWRLQQRYPDRKILLLEKESSLAQHQTGHNSGVIHSGIYYTPGSLKARFCKQGLDDTMAFCRQYGVPHEQCGKLLVATNQLEVARMHTLFERCRENNIDCELLSRGQLRQHEPNIYGIGAIYVPATGIVDYTKICEVIASEFRRLGGRLELNNAVTTIRENDAGITLQTWQGQRDTAFLVCCAGLQSDRLARMHGLDIAFRIIPFRGEYYRLAKRLSRLITHLVYPVPDPALPFLGIHITRMIDGDITVGPNAVPGWKREGYGRVNFNVRDSFETVSFGGFWKLVRSNLAGGLNEMKNSMWKTAYLKQVQKYCPQITAADLLPYPAGVRAQAVLSDGALVHDFLFAESSRSLHVCNAPSPAATSAFPIAGYLCDRITEKNHQV